MGQYKRFWYLSHNMNEWRRFIGAWTSDSLARAMVARTHNVQYHRSKLRSKVMPLVPIDSCSCLFNSPFLAQRPYGTLANSVDPDQTPHHAVSDRYLHCLST